MADVVSARTRGHIGIMVSGGYVRNSFRDVWEVWGPLWTPELPYYFKIKSLKIQQMQRKASLGLLLFD